MVVMTTDGKKKSAKSRPPKLTLLGSLLICPLCHDCFTRPKILPCLHSFCEACLEELVEGETRPASPLDAKMPRRRVGRDETAAALSSWKEEVAFPCPTCGWQVAWAGLDGIKTDYLSEGILKQLKTPKEVTTPHACDLCETVQPAVSYCRECSDYLCHNCEAKHSKNVSTQCHSTAKVKSVHQMAGAHKPMLIQPHCHTHDQLFKLYCKDCQEPVCFRCKIENHVMHKVVNIQEGALEEWARLQTVTRDMKRSLTQIATELGAVQQDIKDYRVTEERELAHIKNTEKTIIKLVQQVSAELRTELQARHAQLEITANEYLAHLKVVEASLKEAHMFGERLVQSTSNVEAVAMTGLLCERVDTITEALPPPMDKETSVHFKEGMLNVDAVREMYGSLEMAKPISLTMNPDLETSFHSGSVTDTTEGLLVSSCITEQNDIVLCDLKNKSIKIFTEAGALLRVFGHCGDGQLEAPISIAMTHDHHIAVVDNAQTIKLFTQDGQYQGVKFEFCKEPYVIGSDRNHLLLLDKQGPRVWLKHYRNDNWKSLQLHHFTQNPNFLCNPLCIAPLPDQRIAISDFDTGKVHIFDQKGHLIWEENKENVQKYTVNPWGLATTQCQEIVTSDFKSKNVVLLDRRGDFQRYLLTENDVDAPTTLALDRRARLIVAQVTGEVAIFTLAESGLDYLQGIYL